MNTRSAKPRCAAAKALLMGLLVAARSSAGETEPPTTALTRLELGESAEVPAWVLNRSRCARTSVSGESCLTIEADRDPYVKVEWDLRLAPLPQSLPAVVTLEVEFVDDGAGLIQPRLAWNEGADGPWLVPTRRVSFTRLNTRSLRRAWFEFVVPDGGAHPAGARLRIAGLQDLRAVRLFPQAPLEAWARLRASVPRKVRPMVVLQRPLELVTTAGVDVTGDASTLDASLEAMVELAPLARVLGFTAIESYVTWKRLEPRREGEFDFSFYDAVVQRLAEYDLRWSPLLIVGSGYALPDWFLRGPENQGFVCLEHGLTNAIQSIWAPSHRRHVTRVLGAFGAHYEPMKVLEAVRLGPSGNYGESQYPAGGNWGPAGGNMHIHIGWWAGDVHARADYRRRMESRYHTPEALNRAWGTTYRTFEEVEPRLPARMLNRAERLEFTGWYTDAMSDWCAWWAEQARLAMPHTRIYQSAGGWGFRESGTDYSAQTRAMQAVDGGTRLTNETDSYEQNFYATRLAATAARLYRVRLGYEPASSHTARGVVARIFGTTASNGDHLFTYHNNLFEHPMAIERWLKYVPVLETRQDPLVEVAVYYPETENQLGDAAFRHLYAWGFNPVAREIRRVVEVDYLDDRLVRDGFLDRYKVLVFAWGNQIPADVQERVDRWLRAGGTVIYPSYPRGPQEAIDEENANVTRESGWTSAIFQRWVAGDTGHGQFHRFPGDPEPPELYGEFVAKVLAGLDRLHVWTREVLAAKHPTRVFISVQSDGHALVLNSRDEPASVTLAGSETVIEPYGIARLSLSAR